MEAMGILVRDQTSVRSPTLPGPWVLVVGMHRSGTSATTGVLSSLGLGTPPASDLMARQPGNPNHFESRAMTDVDDRLLEALGGSWSAPPPLPTGWEHTGAALGLRDDAVRAVRSAYPTGGARAWKDPRSVLVLPFWRELLAGPWRIVLVWRSPLAVARSLARRDGLTISHGLALWHWYNRAALAAAQGDAVHVVSYEDLVRHPADHVGQLARWLTEGGVVAPAGAWDETAAVAAVGAGFEHEHSEEGPTDDEVAMSALLGRLAGSHPSFTAADVPPLPPWVADYLEEQRGFEELRRAHHRLGLEHIELADTHRHFADEHQRLARAHEELCEQYGRLTDELEASSTEVARLSAQVAAMSEQLDAVRSSRTWRWSAPGRAAIGWLRRRLRR